MEEVPLTRQELLDLVGTLWDTVEVLEGHDEIWQASLIRTWVEWLLARSDEIEGGA